MVVYGRLDQKGRFFNLPFTFAKMLNISASSLSKYETGRSEPSIELLWQIADILEVSIDYLVGINELKYNYSELNKQYVKNISNFKLIDYILYLDISCRKHLVEEVSLLKMKSDFMKIRND